MWLFDMDLFRSAGYSNGEDQTRSPWITPRALDTQFAGFVGHPAYTLWNVARHSVDMAARRLGKGRVPQYTMPTTCVQMKSTDPGIAQDSPLGIYYRVPIFRTETVVPV